MDNQAQTQVATPGPAKTVSVKIFGIGSAGVAMLESMAAGEFTGASFVAVNTDAPPPGASSALETIRLEAKPARGLGSGTGGDPERGRALAEEHFPILKKSCEGADVVLLVAGLGGGAGTGISPVLARAAKESGALVLGFVTLPFDYEGNYRQRIARPGLDQLKAAADGVVCLPNQRVSRLIDENTCVLDAFKATTQLLIEGAAGVWRLLAHTGLIPIHFDDLCALLRDGHGESCFAVVEATGKTSWRDALEILLAHPMLEGGLGLSDAEAVLVSLFGGPDLTMADVNRVMERVNRQCEQAQVIMGAAVDEKFRDRLSVTIIARRRSPRERAKAGPAAAGAGADLDQQLLEQHAGGRPASRFVPPPPSLTPEQRKEILAQKTGSGGRPRQRALRLRQTTLPLEIVTKGRFDKTEPTVHKGEDLDVPTYIRRGVALN
jgi:cell division protein FtsZ